MNKKDFILSLFKLYSGKEKNVDENPIKVHDKESRFKWYMWRNEFNFLNYYESLCEAFGQSSDTEDGIRMALEGYQRAFMMKWVGFPGTKEENDEWYDLYQSFNKEGTE